MNILKVVFIAKKRTIKRKTSSVCHQLIVTSSHLIFTHFNYQSHECPSTKLFVENIIEALYHNISFAFLDGTAVDSIATSTHVIIQSIL